MKYIHIIMIAAMCVSCSKDTEKVDTSAIQKTPEKTEVQNITETQNIKVQDIFETDIFADISDSPLSIPEGCTVTELSDVEVFSLDEKSGMKASISGIYDSVILAESQNFTALYTIYKGGYKLCYTAFYAPTPLSEKWSRYVGTQPYDVLAAFGTPAEIIDTVPAAILYKKDVWIVGDGLTSMCIKFCYEDKMIHTVAVWKQR